MNQGNQNTPIGNEDLDGSAGAASPALRAKKISPRMHLPWVAYRPKESNGWYCVGNAKGVRSHNEACVVYSGGEDAKEIAERISTAVNAHDALVKALQLVLETIDLDEYAAMKAEMVAALALAARGPHVG
jgi:hypothetical protein